MALKRVIQKDLYQYSEEIVVLSEQDVIDARDLFDAYRQKKVVLNESFDDDAWVLTNEVSKVRIDFTLGKDLYSERAAKEIGCSYRSFRVAVRVYAVNNLHYSLTTVQGHIAAIMKFARSLEIPNADFAARVVSDFLELLPGDTPLRNQISARSFVQSEKTVRSPRGLVDYVSYFRFSHCLNQFWNGATLHEKLLYFPVFLWWCLTSILPLRVTEFLLTPRDCVVQKDNTWMIRVRRTRLKAKNGQAKHSIASDYEMLEYPIQADLAKEILFYIEATKDEYANDIDTIFSTQTMWRLTNSVRVSRVSGTHFSISNLYRLLDRFYTEILQEKFHINLAGHDSQTEGNEIARIRPGDTRHIAIINLLVSGSSLVACKELSRHYDIYSAQSYYANITTFLKALTFEYFAPTSSQKTLTRYALLPEPQMLLTDIGAGTKIPEGVCTSARYKQGDFSDCALAVNGYGHIGECSHCKYLIPDETKLVDYSFQAEIELKKACALIHEVLNSYRTDNETLPDIEGILSDLQSAAAQYLHLSVLERQIISGGL